MLHTLVTTAIALASIGSPPGNAKQPNTVAGLSQTRAEWPNLARGSVTTIRFYPNAAYGGATRNSARGLPFYNPSATPTGHATYSGNGMGYHDGRPYSGQAAASAGGVTRHYDARGRYVGSTPR